VADHNVLRDAPLTSKVLRAVVAGIVRSIQAREKETDSDTAERLGVSASTIANARNERNDVSALTLIQIGRQYEIADLAPLATMIGARLTPMEAERTADLSLPCIVTRFQLELSVALEDGRLDEAELTRMRPAVDALGKVVDDLRERMALRAVV
jgi:hypothetical protein